MNYYVYILASRPHGAIYVGFCKDIETRIAEHRTGNGSIHTGRYRIKKLVYLEPFEDSYSAFCRERELKKWKRKWKTDLIEKQNPDWNDLAEDW